MLMALVCMLFGVLALASTARADARLTLDPPSGLCNATVLASAAGLPPNTPIELALALPNSDVEAGTLAVVDTDSMGSFATTFSFGDLGCDTLVRALAVGPLDHLTVYVDDPGEPDDDFIYTRTDYALTTAELPNNGSGPSLSGGEDMSLTAALALLGASLIAAALAFPLIRR